MAERLSELDKLRHTAKISIEALKEISEERELVLGFKQKTRAAERAEEALEEMYCPTCGMFTSQCQCWDAVNQVN